MEFERINVLIEKYLPPFFSTSRLSSNECAEMNQSSALSALSTTLNEFILFAATRVCCQVEESLTCKRNTH